MTITKPARRGAGLSTDATLGIVGCCLAAASASFGIFMTLHGPLAGFGKSGDFTVFAQLAPRAKAVVVDDKRRTDEFDTTATASIPKRAVEVSSETAALSSVTVQTASANLATVLVDGQPRVVRVGDTIPGAGEVLSIIPGARPIIRTSRGLIASAQDRSPAP